MHELDWAKPKHQEGSVKFFKLCHAYEEVEHLNIEVHHLHTAIHDEGTQMSATINKLLDSNPPLSQELQKCWKLHSAVNSVRLFQLDEIEAQHGFSENESGAVECLNCYQSVTDHNIVDDIALGHATDLMEHKEQIQTTQAIVD
ncbi:hypothetical protein BDR06DRAFT_973886 [Suillus hirtellus]|nr:hypothetical protein BDR06DRAFT_973886 [Suillus hirtellus]